jgi:hypothetical protein
MVHLRSNRRNLIPLPNHLEAHTPRMQTLKRIAMCSDARSASKQRSRTSTRVA